MTAQTEEPSSEGLSKETGPTNERRMAWPLVLVILLVSVLFTGLITAWAIKTYIFPDAFTPVSLSSAEERRLDAKLDRLEGSVSRDTGPRSPEALRPEPYSEVGAERQIVLTERELNALIARNSDLATRVAIDLSRDLASANLLITLDETAPILGGETVKVTGGLELRYAAGRPVVILKGISIWGVPLPNAWMGGLKNVDLVREFGVEDGFWKGFADGVEDLRVEEGVLKITLKE